MKMPVMSSRRRRRGFTLMELLLVLAIIGLLMGGGAAVYSGIMDNAKDLKTRQKIGTLEGKIQMYTNRKSGKYPTQSAGLQALKEFSLISSDEEITDNWGKPLIYTFPAKRGGNKFDLWSAGIDGIEGTADDIGNWQSGE